MVLVVVVVVGVAGFCVYRLHGIFGSHNNTSAAGGISDQTEPFSPKHITLEVFGNPGGRWRPSNTWTSMSSRGKCSTRPCRGR